MTAPDTILALAKEFGTPADHLRKWKSRQYVPFEQRIDLIAFAATKGITLEKADFDWRDVPPPRRARQMPATPEAA